MAWNGSDGSAGSSTQRTPSKGYAKNAKAGGGLGGAPRTSRPTVRELVAFAIVVIGGGVAWRWIVGRQSPVPDVSVVPDVLSDKGQSTKVNEVALKRDPPAEVATSESIPPKDAKTAASPDDALPPHKRIVEMISVITNADGSVLERFRTADGKTRSRQSAPKPVFDNASDQMIALAVSGAASGGSMPPMPMMDNADEAFAKSLEKEIVINDDDSEKVKALKREVQNVREEMRQLIAEGQSFSEVMKNHRDMVNRNAELRKEATRILEEFVEGGDADAAQECLENVNAALGEAGIDGIEMPMSREERRAAIRERNANAKSK